MPSVPLYELQRRGPGPTGSSAREPRNTDLRSIRRRSPRRQYPQRRAPDRWTSRPRTDRPASQRDGGARHPVVGEAERAPSHHRLPLRNTPQSLDKLVADLDERGLAALAIKLGRYLESLPAEMIAQADRRGFPLILLPNDV